MKRESGFVVLGFSFALCIFSFLAAQIGSFDSSGRQNIAPVSGNPCHIASATTTACKGTAGTLLRVVNGTGIVSATTKIYDVASGSCSGTPGSGLQSVITFPLTLTNPETMEYGISMANGICVVTSGVTDITVVYQ